VGGINFELQGGYVIGGKVGLQYVSDEKEEGIVLYYARGSLIGKSIAPSFGPIMTNATNNDEMEGDFIATGGSFLNGSVDVSGSINKKGKLIITIVPSGGPLPSRGIPYETHVMHGKAKIILRWNSNVEEFWQRYYDHH